ncbi:tryptophan halogenase [Sphingomonas sp. Leaf67]|uniref:tryptophan halogenase family protein n=1 Tax=Sphingomonas sp. Leaf67 TaxID=1736230 RepID=UPI0006F986D7|nr:tryptophan halogenase family protein [Sphingomonas sp. Leaf67]KQN82126.1 tryptophan halogenase [Sphingomonas sp. Leaf67]
MPKPATVSTTDALVRQVVIVGGGTAGWMAAAALSRALGPVGRHITLIESDAIGTVGVGEATIPPIRAFNAMLDIAEDRFLRETMGSYKLGIEFVDWGRIGQRYFHPFGAAGQDFHGVPFHQLWLRHRARGGDTGLTDYSMCTVTAREGRFGIPPAGDRTPLAHIAHAYHFDATLYAALLRRVAEEQGVVRHEGRVVQVDRDGGTGDVTAVRLDDGRTIAGDLFVDCSGFAGLLIEGTLATGYHDWRHWLPMDRALAMPTTRLDPLPPYTRATAHAAGWQWRIPLQHRTGNGHVYSSGFTTAEDAERLLRDHAPGEPCGDVRSLSFTTGMRRKAWSHNVVALGLAAGFVEPLESTSIHLIQHGIQRLIALFPGAAVHPAERDAYNADMARAFEAVRDFVVLHYKATTRNDSDFWRTMRAMTVPDSLSHRIELWRAQGRLIPQAGDIFAVPSWAAVLTGQELWPAAYEPGVDRLSADSVEAALRDMHAAYRRAARSLPMHAAALPR